MAVQKQGNLKPISSIKLLISMHMSNSPDDDSSESAERVVGHNDKFNVPVRTEKEEAETFENAEAEDLANEEEIRQKKQGMQ